MRITNMTTIDANPAVVWAVTMDVGRWPEWTPTVTSVRITRGDVLGPGSVVRIKQPMQPEAEWAVTEFIEGRRFAWTTRRAGLRMTASHELVADGEGTRNTLSLEAEGPVAALLGPVLGLAVRKALADENRGLKERCERMATVALRTPAG